ncbi:pentapeptide repeat-containing protein [Streptomyces sp. NBC_01304]|uniref:pentapeptide repeat-containing protein n=1 Tax=Streptomyces sp. NBC_01304 TaxID=2903818 RepID=UPI002E15FE22|nr:pentapeptide repeat-containing protein [Streptomyces sp. NBC_01304]
MFRLWEALSRVELGGVLLSAVVVGALWVWGWSRAVVAVDAAVGRVLPVRPRAAIRLHRAALAVRRSYAAGDVPDRAVLAGQRDALVRAVQVRRVMRVSRWVGAVVVLGVGPVLVEWGPWTDTDARQSNDESVVVSQFVSDSGVLQAEVGAQLGMLVGGLVAAVWTVRAGARLLGRQVPLPECASALAACPGGNAAQLDDALHELRTQLEAHARHGHRTPPKRTAELVLHARAVGDALHHRGGAFWHDSAAATPELVRLLGTVQDRAHAGSWLNLVDPVDLPAEDPEPLPARPSARERWSGFVHQAGVLLPALAAVGALVFSAITVKQSSSDRRVAEEAAVTGRFSTATSQLDDESVDIRLGGLLALERLIEDSPRDHQAIARLLCAYVRVHASTEREGDDAPEDVVAALRILGERQSLSEFVETPYDLHAVRIRQLVLEGVNFSEADFTEAELPELFLEGQDLMSVKLDRAVLTDAELVNADLREAELDAAQLTRADLSEAVLEGASMVGTQLEEADLQGAELRYADLSGADLSGADLSDANLSGADLTGIFHTKETRWPKGFRPPASAEGR